MKKRLSVSLAAVLLVALAVEAAPPRIPANRGEITLEFGKVKLKVFTFRPANYDRTSGPMLLIFHGHGKNADGYRNYAEIVAMQSGGLVIAPLFDEMQFPGNTYTQGNVLAEGKVLPESDWTFRLVPQLIDEIRKIEDRPKMPYHLWGHSGGGQFVVRLLAFVKLDPVEAVAANPGSALFPTRELPYPYGFGKLPAALGDNERIKAYLACRLTLYAGTDDVDPKHPQLDKSANAEKQGPYRLARARNDFQLANKVAKEEGWKCNWRLIEAPGVDHSAGKMLRHTHCIDALFGRRE